MKPVVALVTARAARGLDEDQAPLEAALRAAGARVEIADWDEPRVDWAAFDMALLRSTWDYTDRLAQFLAWADAVAAVTTLCNPPAVVRWNTDKHYLSELAARGVPTVASTFVEPGASAAATLDGFLSTHREPELVVKPAVGAGSRDTQRYLRNSRSAVVAHAERLLDAGRSVLLQPYLDRVDEEGETALVFFAGRFSHAICKGAMLPSPAHTGDPAAGAPGLASASAAERSAAATGGTENALFRAERITSRRAAADERNVAAKALAAIPGASPLYARVDLIRGAAGEPVLLELELTEPSLFFGYAEGSAERFARAVLERVGAMRQPR